MGNLGITGRPREAVKTGCILAAITVLLLVAVETAAFLALRGSASEAPVRSSFAYQRYPWAETFWREYDVSRKFAYQPYVVWRRAPYRGETITVDAEGLRRTEHSQCGAHEYRIYMFGGSTLWGTGSPDWGTIPSLLAEQYQKAGRPVCVRNYGESAWVSTQGTIKLLLELKHGERRPDLVIFYDGVNDVFTAWQAGRADVHQDFDRIKARFEPRAQGRPGTFGYLLDSNASRLLQDWLAPSAPPRTVGAGAPLGEPAELARAPVAGYLRNLDVVDALAERHGFDYVFFWQPVIFADQKPLTKEEQEIRRAKSQAWPGLEALYRSTYDLIVRESRRNLVYIADVFKGYQGNLYLDFTHISPDGNRLVAQRMYETLTRLGL